MSQHEGQWRHSRSRNKRLFTMKIPPASLPRLLPVWAGLLLAAFSGILMVCAFIPVDWGGCVWIGFLPLLTALWYGRGQGGEKGNAGIHPVWLDVWGSILRHFLLVGQ